MSIEKTIIGILFLGIGMFVIDRGMIMDGLQIVQIGFGLASFSTGFYFLEHVHYIYLI